MKFSPLPALIDDTQLISAWESLSLRMQRSHSSGFSGDTSSEELHQAHLVEQALQQLEELGQSSFLGETTTQSEGGDAILKLYRSEANGLREEIRSRAEMLARDRDYGTEPFAFTARLLLVAATIIAQAARQSNDTGTLNEIVASLEVAISGLNRSQREDAKVLSLVLRHELSASPT